MGNYRPILYLQKMAKMIEKIINFSHIIYINKIKS